MTTTLEKLRRFAIRQATPFLSPRTAGRALASVPWFVRSRLAYASGSKERIPLLDTFPLLFERTEQAGTARGHYFHQDVWAARKVFESGAALHVDVGSRVDGFVAHCASFTTVEYVDIRPLETPVPSIRSRQGTVLGLPYEDRSIGSLSCLHVAEHVGLGRYGDPIDPDGTFKAIRELTRVLALGGNLYFGIPIGRERVCFNAHRVYFARTILDAFGQLAPVSFAAVDDNGDLQVGREPASFDNADYACGLFHFRRPV